ncbi:MAG: hypothetical protein HYT27_01915 [Parcubacteria group bacterium]|nr:hypothetical protein [Parcubacteria group bacterium]
MTKRTLVESDADWQKDREAYKWELPETHPLLRLPVIKETRWLFHKLRFFYRNKNRSSKDMQFGEKYFYDMWIMSATPRGWC